MEMAFMVVASRRLAFIEHPESPGRNSPESAGSGCWGWTFNCRKEGNSKICNKT